MRVNITFIIFFLFFCLFRMRVSTHLRSLSSFLPRSPPSFVPSLFIRSNPPLSTPPSLSPSRSFSTASDILAKTSLQVHIHRSYDKPGAAADILGILKANRLNLTHLDGKLHCFAFEGATIEMDVQCKQDDPRMSKVFPFFYLGVHSSLSFFVLSFLAGRSRNRTFVSEPGGCCRILKTKNCALVSLDFERFGGLQGPS